MRKSLAMLVVVCSLLFPLTGFAFEFSSDMVMTAQGRSHESKVQTKDSKFRMESKEQPGYQIIRGDKNVMWMVMPEQKTYMEMKFDPSKKPRTEEKVQGEVSRKLIGPEKVDGHPAQKYEVTYTESGKTDKMYQWMATDIKFPVKMAAIDGSWVVEYKNIKMGQQADNLFEVPAGFQISAMPAIPNMLGGDAAEKAGESAAAEPDKASGQGTGGLLQKLPKLNLPKLPKW